MAIHVVRPPDLRIVGWVAYYLMSAIVLLGVGLRRPPDLIYFRETAYNLMPIPVARMLRCPLIIEINGFLLDEMRLVGAGVFERWLIRVTQQITCDEADLVVAVSSRLRDLMIETFGLPRTRITIVPNGVDPERARPEETATSRERLGLAPGPVIGFLGSCYPYHDIDTLISAALSILAHRPDVRFVVGGDGPMRETWMRRVTQEGLEDRFLFTGRIPYADVPTYISAFTIGIAVFTQEAKGLGMKLFDYMACGRPMIATDLPGDVDIVRKWQVGILIAEGDAAALTCAAVRLLDDPVMCETMGRNARHAVVEYFNWRRAAQDIVHVAHETIA
ncbi:MAG: glycosyltransferase family 4 protein [candidate division Zixibacteria bacterium]|nr:glycosyltransferase family 4 protein [candidate division Zixibacteria bacterium]